MARDVISIQRIREFSDLVLAACRLFDASEVTAHKVIIACLESVTIGKVITAEEIQNIILKEDQKKVARVARRKSTTPKGA